MSVVHLLRNQPVVDFGEMDDAYERVRQRDRGEPLNMKFTLWERLRFAYLAFRYPHALRNTLHFVQEARECARACDDPEIVSAVSLEDLQGEIEMLLSDAEELLKLLQDYGE